jgi:hypothetical protein
MIEKGDNREIIKSSMDKSGQAKKFHNRKKSKSGYGVRIKCHKATGAAACVRHEAGLFQSIRVGRVIRGRSWGFLFSFCLSRFYFACKWGKETGKKVP